jgi:hypothetical protein
VDSVRSCEVSSGFRLTLLAEAFARCHNLCDLMLFAFPQQLSCRAGARASTPKRHHHFLTKFQHSWRAFANARVR